MAHPAEERVFPHLFHWHQRPGPAGPDPSGQGELQRILPRYAPAVVRVRGDLSRPPAYAGVQGRRICAPVDADLCRPQKCGGPRQEGVRLYHAGLSSVRRPGAERRDQPAAGPDASARMPRHHHPHRDYAHDLPRSGALCRSQRHPGLYLAGGIQPAQ